MASQDDKKAAGSMSGELKLELKANGFSWL